jgi:complex iron-sulfur molybdoenzyme family reductase subunit gamma
MWALRATWKGSDAGVTEFPDAMAIALPVRNFPVLALMGSKDAPIHYLRWIAGEDGVRSVLSTGIGESRPGPELKRAAQARADGAMRQVVVARALGGGREVAPLLAGTKTAIGFAVWNGANEERAGLKAFSVDWIPLEMEA